MLFTGVKAPGRLPAKANMKICIDGFPLLQQGGGINRYGRYLLGAMLRESPGDEFTLFLNTWRKTFLENIGRLKALGGGNDVRYKLVKMPRKFLNAMWLDYSMMPVENFIGKVDVYHSLHCVLPYQKSGASVLTIHDVAYLKHPEFYQDKKLCEYDMNYLLKKSAPRATKLIVISESTKRDVCDMLNVPEEKMRVIYYGIDHEKYVRKGEEEINGALSGFGIPRPYILSIVGTLEPRKNIPGLLRAFSLFKKRSKLPHTLVIAGAGIQHFIQQTEHVASSLALSKDVVFLSNLQEEQILCLYSGAEFFVYPSLYEGFGLPVLEAMCFGLPVACSSVSSLPEVAEDAGVYFNPYNVEEMAYMLLLLSENDAMRKSLAEKSRERAKQFSWEKSARETLSVYREVAS